MFPVSKKATRFPSQRQVDPQVGEELRHVSVVETAAGNEACSKLCTRGDERGNFLKLPSLRARSSMPTTVKFN